VNASPAPPPNQHEEKILLVLTLIIGAVVGLIVVAFILLTENLGARLYPPGGAAWRRVLVPVAGALFTGFLLTGFGSAYYHVAPDDGTLFWDRLPMTISFMALLAGALGERFGEAAGRRALWPLLALGAASLVWWRWMGDLRPYVWVQFYPCLALPILYLWFPATTGTAILITAAVLYGLSKALEYFDRAIYAASGAVVSGHTLKHLAAAAACYALLQYVVQCRPLAPAEADPRKAPDAA